jgi:hypothetical protein
MRRRVIKLSDLSDKRGVAHLLRSKSRSVVQLDGNSGGHLISITGVPGHCSANGWFWIRSTYNTSCISNQSLPRRSIMIFIMMRGWLIIDTTLVTDSPISSSSSKRRPCLRCSPFSGQRLLSHVISKKMWFLSRPGKNHSSMGRPNSRVNKVPACVYSVIHESAMTNDNRTTSFCLLMSLLRVYSTSTTLSYDLVLIPSL